MATTNFYLSRKFFTNHKGVRSLEKVKLVHLKLLIILMMLTKGCKDKMVTF